MSQQATRICGMSRNSDGSDTKVNLLKIISTDHLITENGRAHRTSKYEIMNRSGSDAKLVVRRGQIFHLKLNLNREYDFRSDEIQIHFKLEGSRDMQKGSCMMLSTLDSDGQDQGVWQASLDSKDNKSITIKIKTPADVVLGKWKLEVCAKVKKSIDISSNSTEIPIYIILNPWCPDDTVYMESEQERQEYIMADEGCIWHGTKDEFGPVHWSYAQFSTDILDCAIYLISEIAKVAPKDRKDPVLISRGLSAAINSLDDNGVLIGNWSKKYCGGTPPTKWMGSKEILKKYYDTKKPVKYGQCWVFAGVLTTICRAIGMPCRVVTNFASAHDTQGNLNIDYVYEPDTGKKRTDISEDSVWNFHVWNEVWMERLDIGTKYGGWQVIDATPQETSDDIYQCGPASVVAIKHGEVHLPYDGTFAYAEVNADEYHWTYRGHGKRELASKDRYGVGQLISTKAVGSWEREDITHTYKFPEDTIEEREAMSVAHQYCKSSFDQCVITNECTDLKFDLKASDNVFGIPLEVQFFINNESIRNSHKMTVVLRAESVLYTGKQGELLRTIKNHTCLQPGEKIVHFLNIPWEEYGHKVMGDENLKVCCSVTGEDTNIEYFTHKNFRMQKPTIEIEIKTKAMVGEVLKVDASFVNPLPIPLRDGKFRVMGPGLDQMLDIKLTADVQPGDKASCTFSLIPKLKGFGAISVKFHSEEIGDVRGFFPVEVEPQRVVLNKDRPCAYRNAEIRDRRISGSQGM